MRSSARTMILIALLIFIMLLAGMIFIGLMLMMSYGGGEEVQMAPLAHFAQWVGEVTMGILITIAEWIDWVLSVFGNFTQGI